VSDYKPKVGDRVRVVLEGEVDDPARGYGTYVRDGDGITSFVAAEHVVSIEKIEPPVEVFKEGLVVRRRAGVNAGRVYTLGVGTYVPHSDGYEIEYGVGYTRGFFNAENFERVTLS
jgi:hypothetical protein